MSKSPVDVIISAKVKAQKRKAAQRAREKALDIKEVRVLLSAQERANLDRLCTERAGNGEPYAAAEYLKLMIVADIKKLDQQLAELETAEPCPKCKSKLPGGCNGLFKGEAVCWYHPSKKRLEL